MVHALLISGDPDTTDLIGRLIRVSGEVVLDRFYNPVPSMLELTTSLRTLPIDVVFLDVSALNARSVAEELREKYPGVALIGFCIASLDGVPEGLVDYSLDLPLTVEDLLAKTRAAMCAKLRGPYSKVIAILPAKAGCGASTIAMNAAAHLAGMHRRVVLVDGDLRSGAIADYLGLTPRVGLAETLSLADVASQLIWARHIASKDGVDCLLTNRDPAGIRPGWYSYFHLLRFLNEKYDHVLVDLPELTNEATSFVLQYAARVYIAVTPEAVALSLAQQRLRELEAAGVDLNRVGILVNRSERGSLSPEDIERALGRKVDGVFPNDYRSVNSAINQQTFLPPKSKLSQAYQAFASTLTPDGQKSQPAAGGFMEALRFSRKAV